MRLYAGLLDALGERRRTARADDLDGPRRRAARPRRGVDHSAGDAPHEVEERRRGDLRLRHGGGRGAVTSARTNTSADVRLHRLRRARRDGRHRRNRRGSREPASRRDGAFPARLSFASSDRDAAARRRARARARRRARGASARSARAPSRGARRRHRCSTGRATHAEQCWGPHASVLRDTPRWKVARSAQREGRRSLERTHVVEEFYTVRIQPAPRHSERGGRRRFRSRAVRRARRRPPPGRPSRAPPGRTSPARARVPRTRWGTGKSAGTRRTDPARRARPTRGASPPARRFGLASASPRRPRRPSGSNPFA